MNPIHKYPHIIELYAYDRLQSYQDRLHYYR